MDSRSFLAGKPEDFMGFVENAVESFDASVNFPTLFFTGAFCDAADYSIQTWAVATTCEYKDLFSLGHLLIDYFR